MQTAITRVVNFLWFRDTNSFLNRHFKKTTSPVLVQDTDLVLVRINQIKFAEIYLNKKSFKYDVYYMLLWFQGCIYPTAWIPYPSDTASSRFPTPRYPTHPDILPSGRNLGPVIPTPLEGTWDKRYPIPRKDHETRDTLPLPLWTDACKTLPSRNYCCGG